MASAAELQQAIETYQLLIANYTLSRDRMIARRRTAMDHRMIELDERLQVNQETINCLQRAIESTRAHLELITRSAAGETRRSDHSINAA